MHIFCVVGQPTEMQRNKCWFSYFVRWDELVFDQHTTTVKDLLIAFVW